MIYLKNIKTLLALLPREVQSDILLNSTYISQLDFDDKVVEIELILRDGNIDKIGSKNSLAKFAQNAQSIDGKGKFIFPGFIDPQVHFREPGGEYKETLETGSRSAARGGFTTVITMPNTNPTTDNESVLELINKKAKELAIVRILPTASVTKNLLGKELTEFKKLKAAGAIALTDDGKGIQDDQVMLEAMKKAAPLDLMILDHSEDEKLSNKGAIHLGEFSKKHHVPGIDPRSESEHVRRGCEYSKLTGCHYHVLHISTRESIEHVRAAKKQGLKVTCEVSPHHLLLCDEDIQVDGTKVNANYKMNPPLRSRDDVQACVEAFIDGTVDFIATDHAPHTPEEKSRDISQAPFGIVGLETAFCLLYTHFVKTKKISLTYLINKMTKDAADVYKLKLGILAIGFPADLVLVDLDKNFKIDPDKFYSKGRNTPFKDWKVSGDPVLTIFNGNIVYSDQEQFSNIGK